MKKKMSSFDAIILTDEQFAEIKKMLQSYLRVTALGTIRESDAEMSDAEMSDAEIVRNSWILKEAGYTQAETEFIIGTPRRRVGEALSGKLVTQKKRKAEE